MSYLLIYNLTLDFPEDRNGLENDVSQNRRASGHMAKYSGYNEMRQYLDNNYDTNWLSRCDAIQNTCVAQKII